MITLETELLVAGLNGRQVTEFLLKPSDAAYQAWWPGTHLAFHVLNSAPGHIGEAVFMDEFIGKFRVRMGGFVEEAVPGKRIVWRMRWIVALPVRLVLILKDEGEGVRITHMIEAGWRGIARIFDPLFRLHFTDAFARAMDTHARTEFSRLPAS